MIRFSDFVGGQIERIARRPLTRNPQDYEKDGLLYCGVCGERKQAWIDWMPDENGKKQTKLVPVMCKCEEAADNRNDIEDKRKRFAHELRQLRDTYSVQQEGANHITFETDDNPDGKISRTLRRYVEKWDEMRDNNIGILLYGNKGTGKSFYAACVANALADNGVRTCFTTTARMMNILQGTWEKTGAIDHLNNFRLVVLDDLGAERDTPYGSEMMYNIIDSRYRVGMPIIITTNIDIDEMQKETDLWRSRLYDRILEMCPMTIRVIGESRRTVLADERRRLAREMLKNTDGGD